MAVCPVAPQDTSCNEHSDSSVETGISDSELREFSPLASFLPFGALVCISRLLPGQAKACSNLVPGRAAIAQRGNPRILLLISGRLRSRLVHGAPTGGIASFHCRGLEDAGCSLESFGGRPRRER